MLKRPIKTKFYKIWDKKIYEIIGGLTVMTPAKGKWVNQTDTLFSERMIPMRIACTRGQLNTIIQML